MKESIMLMAISKNGYLRYIEKSMAEKLPGCDIKAKPHVESRIKTLKTHFQTVDEMLTGPNCNGFGWDVQRRMVTAKKPVWDAYLQSHKEAISFRHKTFPFYEELCLIYGKDQTTKKDVKTPVDAIVDIQRIEAANNDIEGDNLNDVNLGVYVDYDAMSCSHTSKRETSSNGLSKKRKKAPTSKDDEDLGQAIKDAAIIVANEMRESCRMLSRAITGQDIIEKQMQLSKELMKLDRLTMVEKLRASTIIARDHGLLRVFYGRRNDLKEVWVRLILEGGC
ncbi:hypothetical protein Pint_33509 [Pistacia integerrima]|uniref:Uncharacterized protein n=1 Tax=Pistacia integerrima TaxID=434235 RepID=A0ACC0X9E8_9ROSI|nr:hypothetical protein Pint_33509 [Pistacia integerrima]